MPPTIQIVAGSKMSKPGVAIFYDGCDELVRDLNSYFGQISMKFNACSDRVSVEIKWRNYALLDLFHCYGDVSDVVSCSYFDETGKYNTGKKLTINRIYTEVIPYHLPWVFKQEHDKMDELIDFAKKMPWLRPDKTSKL